MRGWAACVILAAVLNGEIAAGLFGPGAMACGIEPIGASRHGRTLNVFEVASLSADIAKAVITGDIDRAAELLKRAVNQGNGQSIVRGFRDATAEPGHDLSIVQTIVRALSLGVNKKDLASTVEEGGHDEKGGEEVAEEVQVILQGAGQDGSPSSHQTYTSGSHVLQQSGPPPYVFAPFTQTTPLPQQVQSPSQVVVVDSTVGGGFNNTYQGPVSSGGDYVVMLDPLTSSGNFLEQHTARTCRGLKEENCCQEYVSSSRGCQCDSFGHCRFTYVSHNPVILQDTRRDVYWVCVCSI